MGNAPLKSMEAAVKGECAETLCARCHYVLPHSKPKLLPLSPQRPEYTENGHNPSCYVEA